MMGLPGMLYNVHYPGGVVDENVTLFGGLKQVGEGIVRPTGRWVVTELHLPEDGGVAFELFVTREVHT